MDFFQVHQLYSHSLFNRDGKSPGKYGRVCKNIFKLWWLDAKKIYFMNIHLEAGCIFRLSFLIREG